MNIAVVNFSGNVGKTTIVRHLLAPNLPDHTIVAVETINLDRNGKETITTSGRKVGKNIDDLIVNTNTIFDVGGSNIEGFMAELQKRDGAHQEIDLFLVPVTPEKKKMGDTINIISELSNLGVPPEKIKTVFNLVDPADEESLPETFGMIYEFFSYKGPDKKKPLPPCFMLSEKWTIFKSEVFEIAWNKNTPEEKPLTVYDLAADTTDYKQMVRETPDPDHKRLFARKLVAVRLARMVKSNLDNVFAELVSTPIQGGEK